LRVVFLGWWVSIQVSGGRVRERDGLERCIAEDCGDTQESYVGVICREQNGEGILLIVLVTLLQLVWLH
jgi:hypothetical protein